MKKEKTINDLLQEFEKESNFAYNMELATEIIRETNLNLKAFLNKNYVDYDDYVNRWDLPKEESKVRALIASRLPDLIGFRITCFFQKDESTIYEYLKKYFNPPRFLAKSSPILASASTSGRFASFSPPASILLQR